jgi:hypothetical protein
MTVAATSTGGAEGQAQGQQNQQQQNQQQQQPPQSLQARLRATMFPEPEPDKERKLPKQASAGDDDAGGDDDDPDAQQQRDDNQNQQQNAGADANANADDQQQQQNAGADQQQADDAGAQDDPDAIHTLSELSEALGWESEKVLDLEVPTKIDGKEGKVRIRDLVKSYQLEGHLNQGLMKLAEERKGFEAETSRKVGEVRARIGQLNQAVTLAAKILDGEYADVDWQELQRTNPAEFTAKYGAYKMRLDGIQQLAGAVNQENERTQHEQQAAFEAYRTEQNTLLSSKLPEWADKGKRDKDVAEMVATLGPAYGITEQEIKACVDHRQILLALDAMRWQKLQKSKPATLKRVRTAPKLIRPGSQQSRSAQTDVDTTKSRDTLRRTGRVQDAVPLLKRALFPTN